jgi:Uma2 family endonuclease
MTSTSTLVLPVGSGPFTVEDLDRMPDDGRRYELLDGMLLVSPGPGARHQKVTKLLPILLEMWATAGLKVLAGPVSVRASDDTVLRPDVLVARSEDLSGEWVTAAPVLAVEVLSESSELLDRHVRKAAYQRMGTRSYWIVDPVAARLTVFELDDAGSYVRVAEVAGEKAFEATLPFSVRVVPAGLLGTLWGRDQAVC